MWDTGPVRAYIPDDEIREKIHRDKLLVSIETIDWQQFSTEKLEKIVAACSGD